MDLPPGRAAARAASRGSGGLLASCGAAGILSTSTPTITPPKKTKKNTSRTPEPMKTKACLPRGHCRHTRVHDTYHSTIVWPRQRPAVLQNVKGAQEALVVVGVDCFAGAGGGRCGWPKHRRRWHVVAEHQASTCTQLALHVRQDVGWGVSALTPRCGRFDGCGGAAAGTGNQTLRCTLPRAGTGRSSGASGR